MQPGSRLAHYVIHEPIGQGGMGTVYLARDTLIGRDVALKVVLAEPGLAPEAKSELQRRLLREAQTPGVLQHPNIITIFQTGVEKGALFIAMELIHGCSLDRLAARQRIPAWLAASVLGQAAAALDYAHGQGVLHRDVKPSNMLVSVQGWVKLCDFGIARWLSVPSSTASFALVGSPAYMSPEQGLNARVGPAADQYSLAVVAYEILSGTQPFQADNIYALLNCHLAQPPPVGPLEKAGLPERTIRALLRGLDKDPDSRYPDCATFVADLFADWPEATQPAEGRGDSVPVTVACPCPACGNAGAQLSLASVGAGAPASSPAPPARGTEPARKVQASAFLRSETAAPVSWTDRARPAGSRHRLRHYGTVAGLGALLLGAALLSLAGLRTLIFSTSRSATETRAGQWSPAPEAVLDEGLPSPSVAGREAHRGRSMPTVKAPGQEEMAVGSGPAPGGSAGPKPSCTRVRAAAYASSSTPVAAIPLERHAPWPTSGGNLARNGLVDAQGLRHPAPAWTLRLPADAATGPVIDSEGRIVIVMADGTVAAVENGRILWIVSLPETPAGGLDVLEGGLVRAWLRDGRVAALTASEGALTRVDKSTEEWREAAMDHARQLFFVSGRWLRCTGLPGWGLALPGEAAGAPAVDGAAGVAVVCTRDGNVYAVNSGGGLAWSLKVAGRMSTRPAAMPDGGVLVGGADGTLYFIRSGEILWKQMLQAPIRGAPAVSRDGLIHAAASGGCLYGLDPRGSVLWRLCFGNEIRFGPALDDRGRLYAVTAARKLECLVDSRPPERPIL